MSERVREGGRSKRGAERERTETQNVTEGKREGLCYTDILGSYSY